MTDYSELKRLAEAATPGEWVNGSTALGGLVRGGPIQHWVNGSGQSQIVMAAGAEWMREGEEKANAAFIAAANPTAVLALIAENETLAGYLCTCRDCGGEGSLHTGNWHSYHHMEPPEPVMEKCGECDGTGLLGEIQDLYQVITERDQLKAEVEELRRSIRNVYDSLEREYWSEYAGLDDTRAILDCAMRPDTE